MFYAKWSRQSALNNTKVGIATASSFAPLTVGAPWVYNPNSGVVYLQVWNLAAADVTVGTTVPSITIPIAAGLCGPIPLFRTLSTGITIAATANADGSGSALANALVVDLPYA